MGELEGVVKESVSEKDITKRKNKLNKFFFGWVKDNYDKVFIAILILAFIIRLWIFFRTMNQPLWWDEADYLSTAKRWGLGLDIRDIWYYRRGFLFPLIGALFYMLNLGEFGIRFLQVLFSTGIVAVSYFVVSQMFNKKLALISSFAFSLSWILLFFTGRILTDIPAAFFALLALFFFWKGYVLKKGNKFLYLFGLCFALAVLTRMQSFMLAPPFLIYIFLKEKLKAFKNKYLWITLGIFLLLLVPQFVLYSFHYGNPLQDIVTHYLGIGEKASVTGDVRTISLAIFDYFADIPYMLSWIMVIMLIIGILYFFADLFIGFDKLLKNEEIQTKFFVFLWIASLFLIMGYIGSVAPYVEQRYITAGLPFLFLIALSPLVFVWEIIIKKFNINRKFAVGIILLIVVVLMISNLALSNSLIEQKKATYLPVKQAGELIKADSNPEDIVMSTSLPQITYYSERSTYPFDIKNHSLNAGAKELMNYSDGEAGFKQFLLDKKPRYIMASFIFETYPDWILTQGEQNGISYIIMPFFNSSILFDAQTGQISAMDLKKEVKKENMVLTLFYPQKLEDMNGIFIYKAEYS